MRGPPVSCKGGTITTLKNHLKTHGITISTKRLDSEAEENDETEVFPSRKFMGNCVQLIQNIQL